MEITRCDTQAQHAQTPMRGEKFQASMPIISGLALTLANSSANSVNSILKKRRLDFIRGSLPRQHI